MSFVCIKFVHRKLTSQPNLFAEKGSETPKTGKVDSPQEDKEANWLLNQRKAYKDVRFSF